MPNRVSQRSPAWKRPARKSKKAKEQRREAIALLTEWSEKRVPVELVSGSSHLKMMGLLVKMQMDPDQDDFMFKTPFGIMTTVFTLIYDDIYVEEVLPNKPAVLLSMSRFPESRLKFEAHPNYAASADQVTAAEDLFNSWIRENSKLIVTIGDDLRITACVCEMTKAGDGAYMLTDKQAKAIHVVFPEESGIIDIERRDSGAEVTLHNRRTNSGITIRKAPEGTAESVDELLARYPMSNRYVH
jgi:hypothetical protein